MKIGSAISESLRAALDRLGGDIFKKGDGDDKGELRPDSVDDRDDDTPKTESDDGEHTASDAPSADSDKDN